MNLQMSGFSCKIAWLDLFSIQFIGKFHCYREAFLCFSLVINIFPIVFPGKILPFLGVFLVTFCIFNLSKI